MVKTLQYDGRHEKCPVPLVKTKLLLKQLKQGEHLHLRLLDPGSVQDIPRLLDKLNIKFNQQKHNDNSLEIMIIKE